MNERVRDGQLGSRLDRAVRAVRAQKGSADGAAHAAERVWARMSADVEGDSRATAVPVWGATEREAPCDAFRAAIDDHLADRLDPARELLMRDHLTACAECRRAVWEARQGSAAGTGAAKVIALPDRKEKAPPRSTTRWAIAAGLVAAVGLAAIVAVRGVPFGPAPVMAHVATVEGTLQRLEGETTVRLEPGQSIRAGQDIRTSRGGSAVLSMNDGTTLEMGDRAELSMSRRPNETRIALSRGNVIVHAADQREGRFVVATDDVKTAVKGTIYSVNHGVKGTRVSVLQGEVEVEGSGDIRTLGPGEQMVTRPSLDLVSLDDEFAWSRDADAYFELAAQLAALETDVNRLLLPGERYDTDLLGLVPADTEVYIALPNLGRALAESHKLLDERLAESDVLRSWWDKSVGGTQGEDAVAQLVQDVAALSDQLGDEIVVALTPEESGGLDTPLVLADVADPTALRAEIERIEGAALDQGAGDGPSIVIVDEAPSGQADGPADGPAAGPAGAAPNGGAEAVAAAVPAVAHPGELYVWLGHGVMAASDNVEAVLAAGARAATASTVAPDGASPFLTRVEETYAQGVDWLFAVDISRTVTDPALAEAAGVEQERMTQGMRSLGLLGAEHLVVTRERRGERDETEANLYFSGPREGVAGWLAEPGPMGSLAFVAPDAYAAAAFVVEDPAAALDDLLGAVRLTAPELADEMDAGTGGEQSELLREMAAAMGGEVAIALEAPLLPEPTVKVIAEVDDPERLQLALERVVAMLDAEGRANGRGGLTLTEQSSRGRTLRTVVGDAFDAPRATWSRRPRAPRWTGRWINGQAA